jgi:hypothetical protein
MIHIILDSEGCELEWSEKNSERAMAEGWDLFWNADRECYEIQRLDDPTEYAMGRHFFDDWEAIKWVRKEAPLRSHCRLALTILKNQFVRAKMEEQ